MVCKCGYQNENGDIYCAQCGRKLPQKKSGGKGWIIALLLVLAVGIGVVAGVFLIPDGKDSGDDHTEETQEENRETEGTPEEDPSEAVTEEDTTPAPEMHEDGWDEEGLSYYRNGAPLTGLQEISGEYYYFDETGRKQTGWIEYEGNYHYFTAEGPAAAPGWYSDDQGWFCLSQMGKLISNTTFQDETNEYKTYCVNQQGYLYQVQYTQLGCTEEEAVVGDRVMIAMTPQEPVINCGEITLHVSSAEVQPLGSGAWSLWLLIDGEWQDMSGQFTCVSEAGAGVRVIFKEDVSFDGFSLMHNTLDVTVENILYSVTMKY